MRKNTKTLIAGNWKMNLRHERGISPLIARGSGMNPHAPAALPYKEYNYA